MGKIGFAGLRMNRLVMLGKRIYDLHPTENLRTLRAVWFVKSAESPRPKEP